MILLRLFFILVLFASVPFGARAEVLINEIAWMGTAISASDEWMELYNNGGANVDLSGWTLGAADGTPNIALQGIIPAKSFFLLERTNDASVPDVAADLIYTGALSNAGEILILRNASGAEVDRADGSGGWSTLGGNNTTKETAQRTVSGWTTGAPTPRAANIVAAPASSPAPVQPNSGSASLPASADIRDFTPGFKAKIYGNNDVLTAGVEAEFRGGADNLSADEAGKVRFLWSFGDGAYQDGNTVRHTYAKPGSYNISLNVILEPYSSADYAVIKVVSGPMPGLPASVDSRAVNNSATAEQSIVTTPSESAPRASDRKPSGVSDDLSVRGNEDKTSFNTANLPDAGMGGANFWFWFLVSLTVGVIGAAGFLLVKIFYWR